MKVKLGTPETLGSFIDKVISESLRSNLHTQALDEKEKQDSVSKSFDDHSRGDAGGGKGGNPSKGGENSEGGEGEQASSKTMDDEKEKLEKGEVAPEDIIDKLNAIRSGKSFKDDSIGSAMDEYINSLSKAERTALLAFLKGIAQIVTGEIQPPDAIEPHNDPANVSMDKPDVGNDLEKKHVDPNVIRVHRPKERSSKGHENTASPTPITARRR